MLRSSTSRSTAARALRPEAAIDAQRLFAAIAELPDHQRTALVAIDVMGLSYREAGRALRVREATVTTRLHRARTRVAELLGDELVNTEVSGR